MLCYQLQLFFGDRNNEIELERMLLKHCMLSIDSISSTALTFTTPRIIFNVVCRPQTKCMGNRMVEKQ